MQNLLATRFLEGKVKETQRNDVAKNDELRFVRYFINVNN